MCFFRFPRTRRIVIIFTILSITPEWKRKKKINKEGRM